MIVGALGDIPFYVSRNMIFTPKNIQWSGAIRMNEHKRIGGATLVEWVGRDADTMSFELYLSSDLGVDVMQTISKLLTYERTAQAVILTVGEHTYGTYRWIIKSHTIKLGDINAAGVLISATVSLKLTEYLRK